MAVLDRKKTPGGFPSGVWCFQRAELFVQFLQGGLAAQPDLAGGINVDHLDRHELAFFADIGDFVDAVVRHLGDVEQTVHARQDFDERAEIANGHDLAAVDLADFGFRGAAEDAFLGGFEVLLVGP